MPPKTKLELEAEAQGTDYKEWFLDHLKPIVGIGAVILVVGVGLILFNSLKKKDRDQHWSDLLSASLFASPFGQEQVLAHIEEKGSGDVVAHALYQEAVRLTREKEYDEALAVLDRLQAEFPDSYLTVLPSPDIRYPVPGALHRWIEVEKKWEAEHGYQEPTLNTDRVALVETTKGAFWIGFYPVLAKEHVDHFVGLAKSGALNGTSVTSITGSIFEFGGEASKDDDPFNDKPETEDSTIEPGAGRFKVQQERGMISSVAVEGGESGDRFAVVTAERAFELDKRQTVFGRVLNDRYPERKALDEIKNAVTFAKSTSEEVKGNSDYLKIADHPEEMIRIERVTIWAGDKIEVGHEFDVSEVKKPVREEKAGDEGEGETGGGETTTDEPGEK